MAEGPREHQLPLGAPLPSQDPGQAPQEAGENAKPQSSQKLWTCLRLFLALNRSFNFWPLLLARFLGKMPCLLPSTFLSQCCEDRNQLPGSAPSPKDTCDQGRSWPGLGTLHLIRCPGPHLPATGLQERLPPSPDKHLSFMSPQALIPPQPAPRGPLPSPQPHHGRLGRRAR